MLVLQRKKGESIVIGNETIVSISEIGTDWVKLAIDAPPKVKILRSELIKAAQEANREAASETLPKDSAGTSVEALKAFLPNSPEAPAKR